MNEMFYLIIVLLIIFFYIKHKLTFWKRIGIPNVICHNFGLLRAQFSFHDLKCIKKYGKIVGTYEILSPSLLISDPRLIKKVLIENFKNFPNHRIWVLPTNLFGQGLFSLPYEHWKNSRNLISSLFTNISLKKIEKPIEDSAETFLNNIDIFSQNNGTFDIRPYLEAFTLDVALRSLFGTIIDSSNEANNPIVINSRKLLMKDMSLKHLLFFLSPKLAGWFGLEMFDKDVINFFLNLYKTIIEKRKLKNQNHNDILQDLLDSNNENFDNFNYRMNQKELFDNFMTFVIGTFDATASTLVNLIYYMIKNQNIQDNIIKEMKDVFKGGKPEFSTIDKLIYLKACIDELLRMEPTVLRIERIAIDDFEFENISIPKGTCISIAVKAVHRDPDNFENPEKFLPERFLPDQKHLIRTGTYIPFAVGPRNCIGIKYAYKEIAYLFANLLYKYKIFECNETEPLEYYKGPFAMPKRMSVKIERNLCQEFESKIEN